MPAVQLVRLKSQIDSLGELFDRPEDFRKALFGLLDQYSDRTYHPAETVSPAAQVEDSFHTSQVVLSQVELALNGWAQGDPVMALSLADLLWADSKAELRLLAAFVIGVVPMQYQDEIRGKIKRWAENEENRFFLQILFRNGTATIRRQNSSAWIGQIQSWLSESDLKSQRLGLLALRPLVEDPAFQNLPAVFSGISRVINQRPRALQNELAVLLIGLARRSPTETIYFLRQMLGLGITNDLLRLIRRCLPDFPPDAQARMREILHSLRSRE